MAAQNPIITSPKFERNPRNNALSFLNKQDVASFANASKDARQLSHETLEKEKAKEMLHLVLNPEEENVKKLRAIIDKSKIEEKTLKNKEQNLKVSESPVLIRTQGQEEYVTEYETYTILDDIHKKRKLEKP